MVTTEVEAITDLNKAVASIEVDLITEDLKVEALTEVQNALK